MRKLLITLAVLLVVVLGADIAGRLIAESQAAKAIAKQTDTTSDPDVTIHGFSFLAQALPGSYGQITIVSDKINLGPLDGISATVDLYNVRLPASDALKGDTSHLTADSAHVRAVIPPAALGGALKQTGLSIRAEDGKIVMSTALTILGKQVTVSTNLTATVSDGILHLAASLPTADGITVPDAAALAKALSLEIPLSSLSVPVTSASVVAQGSDLVVTADLKNLSAGELK